MNNKNLNDINDKDLDLGQGLDNNDSERDILEEERSFKEERKKDITQVGLIQLLYILSLNVITSLVAGLSEDMGVRMIGGTFFSIIIALIVFKKPSFGQMVSDKKKQASLKDILYFFGLGLIFNMFMGLIINLLVKVLNLDITNITELIQAEVSTTTYLYVILIGPFIEELLYRGMILQRLRKYGNFTAIFFSSLFFGLMHQNLVQSFSVLGIAMVLGYVATFYSFKAALLVHILNNLFVMLVSSLADYQIAYYILSIIVLVIALYSLYRFFGKNNRQAIKEKLYLSPKDKSNIKAILTNWTIILVIIVHLAGMILSELVLTGI